MITLSGSKTFIADDINKAYRVISGSVLVFVISADGSESFRPDALCEAAEGDIIPGFSYSLQFGDILFSAIFEFRSDNAEIEEIAGDDAIRGAFIDKYLPDADAGSGLDKAVFEAVYAERVKEIEEVEAARTSNDAENARTLFNIFQLISEKDGSRRYKTVPSHDLLYDAVARICDWQRIPHADYELIKDSFSEDFSVEDIARISGFVSREIKLEKGWEKKETGPLLVFIGEERLPAAILPEKRRRSYIWNPQTFEKEELTEEKIGEIDQYAYMLYRCFPHKSMTFKEMISFALVDFRISDLSAIVIAVLLETLIGLLLPTLNQKIYDVFIPLSDKTGLLGVCTVIIACTLGSVAFGIGKAFANFNCFNRMKYAVQAATFDRLFNLPDSTVRQYESAEMAENAFKVGEIFDVLSSTVLLTGFSVLFSLLYLIRMHKYSKDLSKYGLILIVICMIISLVIGMVQIHIHKKKVKNHNKQNSILYQLISGIEKLRIAGAEVRGISRYMDVFSATSEDEYDIARYRSLNSIVGATMSIVSSILFYYLMIRKDLGLSVGNFIAFTSAYGAFSAAMMELVNSAFELSEVPAAAEQIAPILGAMPENDNSVALPGEITGAIELNSVSFGYDPDEFIIKNLNLSIRAGEYIGVVGTSGCGKSTLLKLLLGFETPQKGKVFYDNKDIEQINKKELRKQFGVVLQDGDTISGTIYENIVITDSTVSMDAVKKAIEDSGLKDDLDKMPMGLHTRVGDGGGGLSGGQKQRLLIARAIVTGPKVLFFDEATSALDNTTQQLVCDSIEKLDCTKFVIAHRLTTIMNCDRILVMDAGRIVEEGSYKELIEKKGLFYDIARMQMA